MGTRTGFTIDSRRTKGNDAVEILENDHNIIRDLLSELADASRAEEKASLLEGMKSFLTVHNATEENLVYPVIRVEGSRHKDAEMLYHQQDEAKVLVWELDAILKGNLEGDFNERFQQFQKALLAHIRKEEATEFPHLREALQGKASAALTNAIREFRGSLYFKGSAEGERSRN